MNFKDEYVSDEYQQSLIIHRLLCLLEHNNGKKVKVPEDLKKSAEMRRKSVLSIRRTIINKTISNIQIYNLPALKSRMERVVDLGGDVSAAMKEEEKNLLAKIAELKNITEEQLLSCEDSA